MSVFALPITRVGPLELRPWTMTTYDAIEALKLGNKSPQNQAIALAWIQSQPEIEVEAAIENGTADDQIKDFRRKFPLQFVPALLKWGELQKQLIDEQRVDVVPRSKPDPSAPGN